MPVESAVRTVGLSHRFGERSALSGIDLDVPGRSVFALLGPNGSGKTTLFRILTTLLRPGEGTAWVAGADVVAQKALVRQRLGIVFQSPSLDKKLTVFENLLHQGSLYGLRGPELRRDCTDLLERFGVLDRRDDRVETLSGGLQRRVELAKSLLHRPRVIVLDEPSTGLDPGARVGLLRTLIDLRERDGVTCLLTTHLMDEAEACDRVAILDRGRLVACDTPSALKSALGGTVLTVRANDAGRLAAAVRERLSTEATVADGLVYIHQEGGYDLVAGLMEAFPDQIDSVTVGRPTLDDVFLHRTGHRLWQGGASATDSAPEQRSKARASARTPTHAVH